MKIKSPLSDLCEVLAQVSDAINQQGAVLKQSEAATRSVLIDPVLRALC